MPSVEECLAPYGDFPMATRYRTSRLQTAKREGFKALASVVHIQTDKRGVPVIQRTPGQTPMLPDIQYRPKLIQITEEDCALKETHARGSNSLPRRHGGKSQPRLP